ncbi:MAG: 5-oxoprolinase subunit PxpB [Chitinophagia bacterium]
MQPFRIYSIHDHALTVEFSQRISEDDNQKVLALMQAIEQEPISGLLDCVPAYSSLTLYHDATLKREDVIRYLEKRIIASSTHSNISENKTIITIPVCYDPVLGMDQQFVCEQLNITREELIREHTAKPFRVYMIGFIPGFPYMGILPKGWQIPRKQTPSLKIPAGSVALAGQQTGIYPAEVPGGWQVIGRTPLKIFDGNRETPCLLKAGDEVKFVSISLNEFNSLS